MSNIPVCLVKAVIAAVCPPGGTANFNCTFCFLFMAFSKTVINKLHITMYSLDIEVTSVISLFCQVKFLFSGKSNTQFFSKTRLSQGKAELSDSKSC